MPDGSSLPEIKISQLPVGTEANLSDLLEASQVGSGGYVSASLTVAQVAAAVAGTLPAPPVIPTTLPPSGAALGDLAGTYPSPTIKPSVGLTGSPTAPTPITADNSTKIATTAFVNNQGYALSGTLGNYLPLAGGSMAAGAAIAWTGRSQLTSPVDGNFVLRNNAGASFGTLQFGGTTNAFPGLLRNGAALSVVLADGSNLATLNANNFNVANGLFYGAFGSITSPGVDGQFTFFNNAGTAGTRLDISTDATVKFRNRTNTADAIATFATQPTTQNDNSGATTAFVKAALAGGANKLLQTVNIETGAVATGTTLIPFDDTIPQITEGNEYMTLAITPQSATSKLIIEVVWIGSNSANNTIFVCLFQDATANALAATMQNMTTATGVVVSSFRHIMTSGTTSSTTFRVRAGAGAAGTTSFNGVNGARLMGGVMASSIVIQEMLP